MATRMTQAESDSPEVTERFWELRALRAHIISNEPELRGRPRASYYPFEKILADAIGTDCGQNGNNLLPRLAALPAVARPRELYESNEALTLGSPRESGGLLAPVDRVVAFVRAGVEAGR